MPQTFNCILSHPVMPLHTGRRALDTRTLHGKMQTGPTISAAGETQISELEALNKYFGFKVTQRNPDQKRRPLEDYVMG